MMGNSNSSLAQTSSQWTRNRTLLLGLLLACALGAFLRFYRLDDLVVFSGDQGRDVTIIQRMIETGQPALLGPGSGAGQFKRGPAYYYLLLPAIWLSGGEPFGGMVLIGLVNVAAIALVFLVGRALVSETAGLVSAVLFALGLVPVVVARQFTNPALLPCLTLLMVYSLRRMSRGDDRFLLVLVGAWLIAWQLHDQVWLLLPFIVVAWVWFKIRVRPRMLGFALLLVLALLAPFLYYEATHDAANLRAMLDYVRSAGSERAGAVGPSGAPVRVVATLGVLARAFAEPAVMRGVWSMAVTASGALLIVRFRRETPGAQLLLLYAVVPLLYALWPGPVYEVNLAIVIPVPFLLCGYGFEKLTHWQPRAKTISLTLFALLCGINLLLQFDSLRTRSLAADSYLTVRQTVAEMQRRSAGQPFLFEYIVETENEEFASPFQYLLKLARVPVTADPLAMRIRVYNPALLAETERGTQIHGLKVVAVSPPRPLGENLLSKPWNLRAQAGQSAQDILNGQIIMDSNASGESLMAVQRVPIEPNGLYLLQFECKNRLQLGAPRIFVSALDAKSRALETYPDGAGYACPPSAGWTPGAALFQSPPGTVRARVLLRSDGVGTAGFRNIQLHPAALDTLP